MWENVPGPLPLYHTASDRKLGGGLGTRLMTPNICVDAHCNRSIIMLEEWASSVQWAAHCHNNTLNLKITNAHAHLSTTPRVAVMNSWQHVTIMIPHIVATIFEQRQHKETLRSGASICYTDKAKPSDCILCMRQQSPSPCHSSVADNAWYWKKHTLRSGWQLGLLFSWRCDFFFWFFMLMSMIRPQNHRLFVV